MSKETVTRQRLHQIRLKAKGLCTLCGKPRDSANKNYCAKHAEWNRKYHLKRYYQKVDEGRCPQCGKVKTGDKVICPKCTRYMRARSNRIAAEGRCIKCGKPRVGTATKRFCRGCLDYFHNKYVERKDAMNKQGLCYRCGHPKPDDRTLCLKCLDKLASYNRADRGYRGWKPGSRGRVPKWYKAQQEALSLGREGPAKGPEYVGGAFMPMPTQDGL